MTSACPQAALGMRHLFLIKQNKGGLWWYHLGVMAPPHCRSHTTADFHFPVIEFLSRLFVFRWSSEVSLPQHLFPLSQLRIPPILPYSCLLISLFSEHNQYLQKNSDAGRSDIPVKAGLCQIINKDYVNLINYFINVHVWCFHFQDVDSLQLSVVTYCWLLPYSAG